jgi:crooked neck
MEASAAHRGPEEQQRALAAVDAKMPDRVKRKRPVLTDDGREAGFEEYFDWCVVISCSPATLYAMRAS